MITRILSTAISIIMLLMLLWGVFYAQRTQAAPIPERKPVRAPLPQHKPTTEAEVYKALNNWVADKKNPGLIRLTVEDL